MKKILIKYSFILIVNLLVFLAIWYYLDKIFNTSPKIIIFSLILSVVSLVILTQKLVLKNLNKLNNIQWVQK
jgi:F0F1-type ATP synthase assembly protein I